MGVGVYALSSLSNLKSYLNISVTTWDTFLESCVDAATAQAETYTGRKLKARAYSYETAADSDDATLDGNGLDRLPLPQYPVNSVTTLRVDGSEIDARASLYASGYVIDKSAGILLLAGYLFMQGLRNIELAYNAGYSTVPDDLEQAVIEQAAWIYKQSAIGGSLLGLSSKNTDGGGGSLVTAGYLIKDFLPSVMIVWEKYKRRFAL